MLLDINIVTDYPLWFSIFCILLGVGYAFVLYRKEDKLKEVSVWLIRTMAGFRFLLITILAFLLLSPFIRTLFNKVEKPVIIIAHDNSSSVLLNKDSTFYENEYLHRLNTLKNNLEEHYEVKTYTFGENLMEGVQIDFSEKITDLSNAFDEITNKYYNRNVGALILASDGIFNQGANPVFNTGIEFPVYTIALGDTSVQRDVILKEVIHNRLTFLSNQFPLEIEAEVHRCLDKSVQLKVSHNGTELFSKQYDINAERFIIDESVLLEADEIGIQHYKVSLSTVKGEISYVNNVKDVYVEVLDGRQQVLILSDAPHPDIKALRLSIESNENYKVNNQLMNQFDGKIEAYNLVIIHQVSSNITPVVKKIIDSDVSILYILGNQTNINQFNHFDVGLNIAQSRNRFNEILPSVTKDFPLFALSEDAVRAINSMPPVVGPFGTYQLKTNGYVLLNQRIGSVETDNPLFVFYQNDRKKTAVFTAEGIWRWRMQDYLKNKNHHAFDELINKTVQFLSIKEDKSKFRVFTKNIYFENEEIQFNAELYNDSYELVNDPEINIDLFEKNGAQYNFVFSRTSKSYILNAGILPPGYYNYKTKVIYGTKNYVETGKFQIKPLLLEANNTVANHQLLQNIAEKFGGNLFYPQEMEDIVGVIQKNSDITSIIYEENELKELISLKWIFFVLLTLVSVEWFLRKRNGAY